MRPASHMPLAEMITAPPRISFSAIDSSTSWTKRTCGRPPLPVPAGAVVVEAVKPAAAEPAPTAGDPDTPA